METQEQSETAILPTAETIGFVFVLALIFSLRFQSYLLFHTFAEFFSVVIAAAYAIIAWHARKNAIGAPIGALGIAYLFVAVLDTVHTLAYAGMGIFVGYQFPANQVWVVARFLEAFALCTFSFFDFGNRAHARAVFAAYFVITVSGLVSIFVLRNFPVCYIAGVGQTPFKIGAEIVIILILIAASIILFYRHGIYDPTVYRMLQLSIVITAFSEFSFMIYLGNYDILNLLGHILKIISFFLVYRAVVVTCLERPQEILFQELRDTTTELRRSNEAKDNFISILSHDLRGPLSGIMSLASSYAGAEPESSDSSEVQAMTEIAKAADSSLRLVERVLAWAKARSGTYASQLENTDAAVVINYEIQAIEGRATRKGVELRVDHASDSVVRTDADILALIVRNLVQNAVKFTPKGGSVTVSSRHEDGVFIIEVADSGVGMDETTLSRLFDASARITTPGTEGEKGSGFGLVLCAEFATHLAGSLTAKSTQGAGSVFTLSLPH
jgi:signal transduction histidine kinase